jgi:hypothetical protein
MFDGPPPLQLQPKMSHVACPDTFIVDQWLESPTRNKPKKKRGPTTRRILIKGGLGLTKSPHFDFGSSPFNQSPFAPL